MSLSSPSPTQTTDEHPTEQVRECDEVKRRLRAMDTKAATRVLEFLQGVRTSRPKPQDYVYVLRKSEGALVAQGTGSMGITQYRYHSAGSPEFRTRGYSAVRESLDEDPNFEHELTAGQLRERIGAPILVPAGEWERDLDTFFRDLEDAGVIG
jgi:hypothetical protein